MIPRLRTVAFLMLLAGLSLGVFAARALRAFGPGDLPAGAVAGNEPRIELEVQMIQRDYHLTAPQTDRVRQELYRYDRRVRDKLLELRQKYAQDFTSLYTESTNRLNEILKEATKDH